MSYNGQTGCSVVETILWCNGIIDSQWETLERQPGALPEPSTQERSGGPDRPDRRLPSGTLCGLFNQHGVDTVTKGATRYTYYRAALPRGQAWGKQLSLEALAGVEPPSSAFLQVGNPALDQLRATTSLD